MTVCHHEHLSPDCRDDFKHRACSGDAWCVDLDQGVDCDCACHLAAVDEQATAAERVVARLDSYSQEQHVEHIKAAREHAQARRAARAERVKAALTASPKEKT